MLNLFVTEVETGKKIPALVSKANSDDLHSTADWQTNWRSEYALQLPNIVALHCKDTHELLGLMSYAVDNRVLAVEIIYIESARHSNSNMLHISNTRKKYIGIAKALFAYAAGVSMENGFDGVMIFKAKTSELVEYYIKEFGASHVGSYDPFRLVIWEDAARQLTQYFETEGEIDHES